MINKKEIINIAIDYDGVLCKSQEMVLRMWNERNGTKFNLNHITGWDMEKLLGITNEELLMLFEETWEKYHLLQPTEPEIGQIVDKIRDNGNRRISIISKRTKKGAIPMIQWLNYHHVHYDEIVLLFDGQTKKAEFPFDILIDDAVENIKEVISPKVGILVDQPWNASYNHPIRVKNLSEAVPIVQRISSPFRWRVGGDQ